jgi:hypothetical protein
MDLWGGIETIPACDFLGDGRRLEPPEERS